MEGVGAILEHLPEGDEYRLGRPMRSRDGRFVVDGWAGARWVPGVLRPRGHEHQVLETGRAFHRALVGTPPHPCLGRRRHR